MRDKKQKSLFPFFGDEATDLKKKPRSRKGPKSGRDLGKNAEGSSQNVNPEQSDTSETQSARSIQKSEPTPSAESSKNQQPTEKSDKSIATPADKHSIYLSVGAVAKRLNISVPTVWRWSRERPEFPRPRKFGARVSRWLLEDLIAFESGREQ